ncbi:AraC family transcriptional regulator [Paenibacillus harenae]|uniref:AraC family transcriptional regulator n=1 Tax=Paenibacillus harenae TaxID=306543 RepID=UPI0027915CEA|nr:AraC family transcriptional regulator [Paenibacillus harenae]MDQ0061712.1 AraC-like DNA-binding protein [Paenibacillus harenae]
MISISGNAMKEWHEFGVANTDCFLTVNCCGYQKLMTRNLERNREQGRADYQLIYIVRGKAVFRFGNEEIVAGGGHMVFYAPGQPQNYCYYAENTTEVYWIHFTGHAVHDYLEQFGLVGGSIYEIGSMDETVALYNKIIFELNMNKPFSGHVTTAYLLEMLALLGRKLQHGEEHHKARQHADITMIIGVMHERYSEQLVIADLARQCSLSPFRFIHKFKDVTGTTPLKYVTDIRMNEAKKLLSESSLHVREVASIVGYDNPLYFSRVFRSTVGMPPSEFKKQFL